MNRVNLFLLAAVLGASLPALAGMFNQIGYGAENQAMGNSTVSVPTDAFSQAYNPALMSFQKGTQWSVGVQGAITSFTGINQVLVDTPQLGGASNVYGDVDTSTDAVTLMTLAVETPLYSAERPWHFGLTLLLPSNKIFEINSPDMFQPQYAMYLGDMQRMMSGVTFSKALSDDFGIGFGGNIYLSQGATSRNRLPSGGEATSRLTSDIRAGVAPAVGLLYKLDSHWNMGLSYRAKMDYQSQIEIDTQLNVLGPTDLMFTDTNSVDYDPDTILLGISRTDDKDTFAVAAKYEAWNGYGGGAIRMNFQTYQGSFSQYVPDINFHDVISLHAGYLHNFTKTHLSAGYAFVPTPVPDQSGETNILDADKHEIFVGWGWRWNPAFWDGILRLDLVGFADLLVPKTIVKTDSGFIGAPGYDIGGMVYGYGLTLTREF